MTRRFATSVSASFPGRSPGCRSTAAEFSSSIAFVTCSSICSTWSPLIVTLTPLHSFTKRLHFLTGIHMLWHCDRAERPCYTLIRDCRWKRLKGDFDSIVGLRPHGDVTVLRLFHKERKTF